MIIKTRYTDAIAKVMTALNKAVHNPNSKKLQAEFDNAIAEYEKVERKYGVIK